jgi:hypothetical protein
MSSRPFLTLVSIALIALSMGSSLGLAADVFISPDEPEHNIGYMTKINKLQPGDHVFFLSQDQRTIQFDYVLGNFLGEGEMGRVFEVKNADGTLSVIKIRKQGKLQKQMMLAEVDAHAKLEQYGINSATLLSWDSRIAIEKTQVNGPTLGKVIKLWDSYPIEYQKQMIQDLAAMSAKFVEMPWAFSDLHSNNIVWDYPTKKWSVVDPGQAYRKVPGKTGPLVEPGFQKQIKKYSKSMSRGFSVASQNPEWLDRTLDLEKLLPHLRSGVTPEDVAQFREHLDQDTSQAPPEYRELLARGKKLLKAELPPEEKKSFLSCILDRIRRK